MRALGMIALLALPAAALAGPKKTRDKKPDPNLPQLEMPALPDLPKADKLDNGAEDASKEDVGGHAAEAGAVFTVKSLVNAQGFRGGGSTSCVGNKLYTGFELPRFPENVQAFQTCVQIASTKPGRTSVQVALYSPSGDRVMDVSDIVGVGANQKEFDYIVSWDGFTAREPGKYVFKVTLGGDVAGEYPLTVQAPAEAKGGGKSDQK